MSSPTTDQQYAEYESLRAAAQRALESLSGLILDSRDPGGEAFGAQYELRQILSGAVPEIPTVRRWRIECRRASGAWTPYSAAVDDEADARADYAQTVAEYGHMRPYRLVCSITTHVIEAHDAPEADATEDGQ